MTSEMIEPDISARKIILKQEGILHKGLSDRDIIELSSWISMMIGKNCKLKGNK